MRCARPGPRASRSASSTPSNPPWRPTAPDGWGLPRRFTDLSRTLQAEAALANGNAAITQARLRSLVWQGQPAAPETLQRWRELLIHAYLRDDLTEDAHLAMLRYRQDYGDSDPALRVLRARRCRRPGR
jgi:hypothetical protein